MVYWYSVLCVSICYGEIIGVIYYKVVKVGMGIECPLCDKRFRTVSGLRGHFQKKHKVYLKACPVCGKKVKNISSHAYNIALLYNCDKHLALYYLTAGMYVNRDREFYNLGAKILINKKIKFNKK